jgi:hypothetical protein
MITWRLWAKALGEKTGRNEKEADIIAFIRTVVLFSYMTTNIFIVAGVIRHWNDIEYARPASDELRRQ